MKPIESKHWTLTIASFFYMLPIDLVLQLWLISVNLTVCTLGYAHEHSIVHDPAARRLVPHCLQARRAYARSRGAHMRPNAARAAPRAGTRYCTRVARGAGTRFSSMPAQYMEQA